MPEAQRPVVSVIVPSYNVERFLDQALNSIEAQTLRDLEIICVNDGSTDGSLDIMTRHAAADRRIRIIDKPNGGYGHSCNRGIDEARGSWIAIVEPDDWIEPTMFEDMVTYAAEFDQAIDIIKTPYWRVVDPDTADQRFINCSYKGRVRPARQPFTISDKHVDHLLIHHPSIWSALYRAEFLEDQGIRFLEIPGAGWADNPFLVETLCQARAIVYLDHAYYCYREETEAKTASFARNNTMVPFERWHDMMDVLERLDVSDESVLRAQYRRGFTYLDYVADKIDTDDPEVRDIMSRMFARMHDGIVLNEPNIPTVWKKRYLQVKGLPETVINPLPYAKSLVSASLYSLKNIGPAETLKLVESVIKRDKTAESITVNAPVTGRRPQGEPVAIDPDLMLSIVVPVYNAELYLEQCLDSLVGQTCGAFEAICVDDGSTDASPRILERYAHDDRRFRIIRKGNGGPSSARNAGIDAAYGQYLCFLDADDLLEPMACQRILEEATCCSSDAIVFGWSCFPEGEANDWLLARTNVRDGFYPRFESALIFEEMTNPYLRLAVKREALTASQARFDETLRVGEDAAFLYALFPRIQSTSLLSDKLYRYRLPHEGSIMSSSEDGTAEKCVNDLNMMIAIFQDWDCAGLLQRYGGNLVHWFVSFLLYTMLRQPKPIRNALISTSKQLLLAHFEQDELLGAPLPPHDLKLLRIVLDSTDEDLGISEQRLSKAMLDWRIAEYGIADLASTTLNRLHGR